MGLKGMFINLKLQKSIKIKSDQNGIESHTVVFFCTSTLLQIKSDQNGIER